MQVHSVLVLGFGVIVEKLEEPGAVGLTGDGRVRCRRRLEGRDPEEFLPCGGHQVIKGRLVGLVPVGRAYPR